MTKQNRVYTCNWTTGLHAGLLGETIVRRVRRRRFLSALTALVASPVLRAQYVSQMRRIAVLIGTAKGTIETSSGQAQFEALRASLQKLGWTEGQNFQLEHRWGEGSANLIRTQVAELVRGKPDIILVSTATALREVVRAAGDIPIVFWGVSDPVGNKFVQNLARPGGKITGFSLFEYEMAGSWLQLLKEAAPQLARVFVLMNTNNPNWNGWLRAIESLVPSLKLQVTHADLTSATQINPAISTFAKKPNGGLLVLPDPFLSAHRELILRLVEKHRLPAIYGSSAFTDQGGLISYGIDQVDLAKSAGQYASRILKGEKVGELPVQKPTKFELAVNLNTAKALGLKIPPSIMLRADRVIE